MPEYQLSLVASAPDKMSLAEARDYAPQWGILIRGGEPGACMYGEPSEPESARAMIAYIESDLLPRVLSGKAAQRDSDSRDLRRLVAYLRTVTGEAEESEWSRASELERGFVECLFFQAPDDPDSDDGDIHREGGVDELAPEAWRKVREICGRFVAEAGEHLSTAALLPDYDLEQAGRDLCFTACGAGVGFTDRAPLENRGQWEALGSPRVGDSTWPQWEAARETSLGRLLDRAARAACSYCEGLYRGDDGRLYLYA